MARDFDWEAYRTTPQSYTIEYISQCSKIGLDLHTLELAKHICNAYPILHSRKKELRQEIQSSTSSISEANPQPALHDALYYLHKLIHSLADSDAGLSFLCICGILGNYFPVQSTVLTFAELVTESAVPDDLAPTVQAWESLSPLFKCLQGSPVFGALVDKYTALGKQESVSDEGVPGGIRKRELQHGSAFSVVGSLLSMSRVSKGNMYEGQERGNRIAWLPDLTSCAGLDAGWETAVAEWLFGLKVELRGRFSEDLSEETYASEEILYSNCAEGEKPQMVVRFAPPGIPVDGVAVVWTPLEVKDKGKR